MIYTSSRKRLGNTRDHILQIYHKMHINKSYYLLNHFTTNCPVSTSGDALVHSITYFLKLSQAWPSLDTNSKGHELCLWSSSLIQISSTGLFFNPAVQLWHWDVRSFCMQFENRLVGQRDWGERGYKGESKKTDLYY